MKIRSLYLTTSILLTTAIALLLPMAACGYSASDWGSQGILANLVYQDNIYVAWDKQDGSSVEYLFEGYGAKWSPNNDKIAYYSTSWVDLDRVAVYDFATKTSTLYSAKSQINTGLDWIDNNTIGCSMADFNAKTSHLATLDLIKDEVTVLAGSITDVDQYGLYFDTQWLSADDVYTNPGGTGGLYRWTQGSLNCIDDSQIFHQNLLWWEKANKFIYKGERGGIYAFNRDGTDEHLVMDYQGDNFLLSQDQTQIGAGWGDTWKVVNLPEVPSVPEPGSMVCMLVGLGAFPLLRKRK